MKILTLTHSLFGCSTASLDRQTVQIVKKIYIAKSHSDPPKHF